VRVRYPQFLRFTSYCPGMPLVGNAFFQQPEHSLHIGERCVIGQPDLPRCGPRPSGGSHLPVGSRGRFLYGQFGLFRNTGRSGG
jgi:hypothetical protein